MVLLNLSKACSLKGNLIIVDVFKSVDQFLGLNLISPAGSRINWSSSTQISKGPSALILQLSVLIDAYVPGSVYSVNLSLLDN